MCHKLVRYCIGQEQIHQIALKYRRSGRARAPRASPLDTAPNMVSVSETNLIKPRTQTIIFANGECKLIANDILLITYCSLENTSFWTRLVPRQGFRRRTRHHARLLVGVRTVQYNTHKHPHTLFRGTMHVGLMESITHGYTSLPPRSSLALLHV